jgi:RecA/RadA recombinase
MGVKGYLVSAKKYRSQYYKVKRFISTGSNELDRLLDYGIEPATKYLFYGEAGTGKTFLLHQIAANMFKNADYIGYKTVYLDLEGNFSTELISRLASEKILNAVYVKKIYDKDEFIEELKKVLLSNIRLGLLLIDNISGLTSQEKEPSSAHIWMRQTLHILNLIKERFNSPIIMTTRVYAKPHIFSYNLIRPRGGLALLSAVNKIIGLSKIEKNIYRAIDEYSRVPAALFEITEDGIRDV